MYVYTDTKCTYNKKVGMHASVVVNGRATCDADGRIWFTLGTYCGCIILQCGMLSWGQIDVQFVVMLRCKRHACGNHFITVSY